MCGDNGSGSKYSFGLLPTQLPPFTWDITTSWNSLLQDIVENNRHNHLSDSNSTTDDEKPLMVKYSGVDKVPSLDMSAVWAVRC